MSTVNENHICIFMNVVLQAFSDYITAINAENGSYQLCATHDRAYNSVVTCNVHYVA